MFYCCWHWQLLPMAESAVNPAMPLPFTSYQLPHPVLPKPKKGCTHQPLRRPPPSPPRHHHCGILLNERADVLAREAAGLPQKAPRMRAFCRPGPQPGPPPGPGAGLGRTPYSKGSGGGGGRECRGRSPRGTERRRRMFTNCGSATGPVPSVSPQDRPPPSPACAGCHTRRSSASYAGKRRTRRSTCCSVARVWLERVFEYSTPST